MCSIVVRQSSTLQSVPPIFLKSFHVPQFTFYHSLPPAPGPQPSAVCLNGFAVPDISHQRDGTIRGLCVWLLSLCIVLSRFIPVAAWIGALSLQWLCVGTAPVSPHFSPILSSAASAQRLRPWENAEIRVTVNKRVLIIPRTPAQRNTSGGCGGAKVVVPEAPSLQPSPRPGAGYPLAAGPAPPGDPERRCRLHLGTVWAPRAPA